MLSHAKPEQKQVPKSSVQKKSTDKAVAASNQTGIPDAMKTRVEELSGFSFDDVRVHYNSDKPAQLQALAYTQGNQVYIGPGQEKHLGHELGHVVQQKAGVVKPNGRLSGMYINNDAGLERDADRFSVRALSPASKAKLIQAKPKRASYFARFLVAQMCLFTSWKSMNDHRWKHGWEFGGTAHYLPAIKSVAKKYKKNDASVLSGTRSDGVIVIYEPGSNTFVAMNSSHQIITGFKPSSGKSYFDRQLPTP